MLNVIHQLTQLATDTEETANQFFNSHRDMVEDNRYYRFNVTHGLAQVKLEEHTEIGKIADATESYMDHGETNKKFNECVRRLLEIEHEGMKRAAPLPDSRFVKQQLLLEAPPTYAASNLVAQNSFQPEKGNMVFTRR